jgi:hypothetical protein
MSVKYNTHRRHVSFLTEVGLEVDEILDSLKRVDYDYLVEQLINRGIVHKNDTTPSFRNSSRTPREQEFVEALGKLRDKYYLLDENSINFILKLSR